MADIVIFYELPERELNNANLLKAEFEKRGYSVDILGYYNYRELIFPRKYKPKLLIGQAGYNNNDIERYTVRFKPKIDKILNLRYEQVIAKRILDSKAHYPKEYMKKASHVCWSEKIKQDMMAEGIDEKNLPVTGDIKTDFSNHRFDSFFKTKDQLASEFNLDSSKEWILFISSFTFNEKDSKPKEKIVLQKKKEMVKKNKKQELEENIAKEIMVDVKGFVVNPGIYKLKEESRVIDAINAAGGVLEGADTSVLNLSKKLKDEMVIIVYSSYQVENFKKVKEEEQQIQDGCINGVNEVENDACIEENGEEKESTLVSINTATLEELMTLEGVGEAKAKSIIAYREEHGPYQAIEDLLNVSGIGESLLAKIKKNITL